MIQSVVTAFVLGLAGGITPGPVLAATFTEILHAGLRRSLRIVFWALLVETAVGFVSLTVLASGRLPAGFYGALSLAGAGMLGWIALRLWKIRNLDSGAPVRFGGGKLAGLILTNGVLWSFWITVCVPKAAALGAQIRHGEILFLLLVQAGWLAATLGITLAFSGWRGLLSNPRMVPLVFKLFALAFLYFALDTAWNGLGMLLGAVRTS